MAFGSDRELVVRVVGDASSLDREFKKASASTTRFGRDISKTSRGAIAGAGAFRGLGRSIAFASAGFLGGFGLTAAVRSAFDEMNKAQKVGAQTAAVIKSTGGVAGVSAEHVQTYADSLLKLTGIDDEVIKSGENMLLTFTNIRNVTGKNNDIFDQATVAALDMATALEGAGFEGGNLQTTAIRLGKALNDPVKGITALRRVGVQFTKDQETLIKRLVESGHVLEAQKVILAEVRREFGGSAAAAGTTLSGKLGVLRETIRNVSADILEKLLPAITRLVDRATAWITNLENQRRIMNTVSQVSSVVADAFDVLRGAFDRLNKITGSTKETVRLLLITLAGFKALQLVSTLSGIATGIGLIGTNAQTSRGQVLGLRGALKGIAAIGVITVAIEVVTHKKQIVDKARDLGVPFPDKSGFDLLKMAFPDEFDSSNKGSPAWALKKLVDHFRDEAKKSVTTIEQTRQELGKAFGAVFSKVFEISGGADITGAKRPGVIPPPPKPVDPKFRRAANEAARQEAVDRAQLAVDRTALTKSVADDIAALTKLNNLLKRRIAGGHDTIEIEREQLGVQLQLNQILEEQAKAQKEAARKRRDARQFRLLGFGPEGEDIVPGVKNLKRQLASVTDAIEGGFLDTSKTRSRLRNIRRVLAEGVGHISADVRSKIQQLLADLRDQLKKSSVDVTRFNKTASGQFVLAGAHGAGSGNITIAGGIHLHGIQNMKQLEDELARRRKQRARQRRSTR